MYHILDTNFEFFAQFIPYCAFPGVIHDLCNKILVTKLGVNILPQNLCKNMVQLYVLSKQIIYSKAKVVFFCIICVKNDAKNGVGLYYQSYSVNLPHRRTTNKVH